LAGLPGPRPPRRALARRFLPSPPRLPTPSTSHLGLLCM
jgi:hypothetical protein